MEDKLRTWISILLGPLIIIYWVIQRHNPSANWLPIITLLLGGLFLKGKRERKIDPDQPDLEITDADSLESDSVVDDRPEPMDDRQQQRSRQRSPFSAAGLLRRFRRISKRPNQLFQLPF